MDSGQKTQRQGEALSTGPGVENNVAGSLHQAPKLNLNFIQRTTNALHTARPAASLKATAGPQRHHLDLLADGLELSEGQVEALWASTSKDGTLGALKKDAAESLGLFASEVKLYQLREVENAADLSEGCTHLAVQVPGGGILLLPDPDHASCKAFYLVPDCCMCGRFLSGTHRGAA